MSNPGESSSIGDHPLQLLVLPQIHDDIDGLAEVFVKAWILLEPWYEARWYLPGVASPVDHIIEQASHFRRAISMVMKTAEWGCIVATDILSLCDASRDGTLSVDHLTQVLVDITQLANDIYQRSLAVQALFRRISGKLTEISNELLLENARANNEQQARISTRTLITLPDVLSFRVLVETSQNSRDKWPGRMFRARPLDDVANQIERTSKHITHITNSLGRFGNWWGAMKTNMKTLQTKGSNIKLDGTNPLAASAIRGRWDELRVQYVSYEYRIHIVHDHFSQIPLTKGSLTRPPKVPMHGGGSDQPEVQLDSRVDVLSSNISSPGQEFFGEELFRIRPTRRTATRRAATYRTQEAPELENLSYGDRSRSLLFDAASNLGLDMGLVPPSADRGTRQAIRVPPATPLISNSLPAQHDGFESKNLLSLDRGSLHLDVSPENSIIWNGTRGEGAPVPHTRADEQYESRLRDMRRARAVTQFDLVSPHVPGDDQKDLGIPQETRLSTISEPWIELDSPAPAKRASRLAQRSTFDSGMINDDVVVPPTKPGWRSVEPRRQRRKRSYVTENTSLPFEDRQSDLARPGRGNLRTQPIHRNELRVEKPLHHPDNSIQCPNCGHSIPGLVDVQHLDNNQGDRPSIISRFFHIILCRPQIPLSNRRRRSPNSSHVSNQNKNVISTNRSLPIEFPDARVPNASRLGLPDFLPSGNRPSLSAHGLKSGTVDDANGQQGTAGWRSRDPSSSQPIRVVTPEKSSSKNLPLDVPSLSMPGSVDVSASSNAMDSQSFHSFAASDGDLPVSADVPLAVHTQQQPTVFVANSLFSTNNSESLAGPAQYRANPSDEEAQDGHLNWHRPLISPFPGVVDLTGQVRTVEEDLDSGGFAVIHLGEWRRGQIKSEVAVKMLRVLKREDDGGVRLYKRLAREVRVWHRLDHPNVVKFYGISSHIGGRPAMIMPWYKNGNAKGYLATGKFSTATKLMIITDIAQGLIYLHTSQPPIIHGDLKGNNILITDDGHAALSDFGLSQIIEETVGPTGFTTTNIAGSMRWQAPEVLCEGSGDVSSVKLTTESDVWSFSCTAYELLTGLMPYYQHRAAGPLVVNIMKGVKPQWDESGVSLCEASDGLRGLIDSGWSFRPRKRPTMPDVGTVLETIHS